MFEPNFEGVVVYPRPLINRSINLKYYFKVLFLDYFNFLLIATSQGDFPSGSVVVVPLAGRLDQAVIELFSSYAQSSS